MMEPDSLAKSFEKVMQRAEQPVWLVPLREAGMSRFKEQGFPTLKDEDWRFTSVAPIAKLSLRPVLQRPSGDAPAPTLNGAAFGGLPGNRLVFVDGHFSPQLSSRSPLPGGVKVMSLAAAMAEEPALVEASLGRYAKTEHNAFAALNQAFFQDGAFIFVPRDVAVPEPVRLVYIASAGQSGGASHPRNLVVIEARGKATVIESYVSAGPTCCLTNAVTEVVAGERAWLELVKVQDESLESFHMATIQGHFGGASKVRIHSFALGARLSRNNIRVNLAGEGLECILNGLYVTKGEQLADHHMIVEHAQPHCASHEYFNGILDDKSRGVFHGRIFVHQVAQKTDAKQTNKNLLISDEATANTKPQLEIYADDVKCTHGATVGQLNHEAVFYLRSRGIGADTARRMLIHAFAGEIIERVQCGAAREELDRMIWDRLEAASRLGKMK
jgi:Fe-S cluster assembly protein SufD